MSSLIFYTDSNQALVATDTLAVEPNGTPLLFCSKATYIPHLQLIVAGTGAGGFAGDWAMYVNNRMVTSGVCNLDCHTPDSLRERWIQHKINYSMPEDITATVYHFGFSEDEQIMGSFAYRSTNDFESERLVYGTAFKPECAVLEGNLIENLPQMMKEQRDIQDASPKDDRLYIGGECIAIHLTRDGCFTKSVFKFEDYADQLQQMFASHECV